MRRPAVAQGELANSASLAPLLLSSTTLPSGTMAMRAKSCSQVSWNWSSSRLPTTCFRKSKAWRDWHNMPRTRAAVSLGSSGGSAGTSAGIAGALAGTDTSAGLAEWCSLVVITTAT